MIADISYQFALFASAVWFAMAFKYFAHQKEAAAKILVGRDSRGAPLFKTIVAGLRFLGGMNGAFAALALVLLVLSLTQSTLFDAPVERAILLAVLALAHFSQFIYNVPVLMHGERQGESYWPVKSGPMLTIFVVDLGETILNLTASLLQFVR